MTGNARRQPIVAGPCRDRISQLVGSLLEESQKPYSATLASHLANCRSCLQTLVALEAAFELDRAVHNAKPADRAVCVAQPEDRGVSAGRVSVDHLE